MNPNLAADLRVQSQATESKPNDSLKTFAEIIEYRVKSEPQKEAFSYSLDGDQEIISWTYSDLKNAIAFVAEVLNQHDVVGQPVVLLFEPGLAFIAAYLATISSGAVAVPCHPPTGKRQVKRLIDLTNNSKPGLILYSTIIKGSTPQLQQVIADCAAVGIGHAELDIPMNPQEMPWVHPAVAPADVAMLQYTSASTGDPKGVVLTQANLVKNSEAIYKWLGPHSARKGCIWLPPYHDMGLLGGIMQPLYAGFPLVFMSPMHFVQRPLRWLKQISTHRLTTTGAPNFAFQLCVDNISAQDLAEANLDLSCAREIFCGSEPINAQTMAAFNAKFAPYGLPATAINPCYGMAETTLFVSGKPEHHQVNYQQFDRTSLEAGTAVLSYGAENPATIVSCGTIGNELTVSIVDPETLTEVADNQVGEVWVAGPSIALGYWDKPELNEIAFNNTLPDRDGRFYRTGDLGFYFNGELYIAGRIKDVIIIRGRNLYPQDLERCALSATSQANGTFAAAFSVQNDDTEALVVVVEIKGRPSEAELMTINDSVYAAIATEFNVAPAQIMLVPQLSIPRTTSGKVQRFACKNAYLDNALRPFKRS